MFWGLVLEPGKRYSTTVEKGFHVSKAALDCSSVRNDNEILSVMLETEGSEALLCSLCKGKGILQENLDLNFMSGDRLTFECRGHGRIHLTGYLLPEDDDLSGMLGDEEDSEEEDEETDWAGMTNQEKSKKEKRKSSDAPSDKPAKKKKSTLEESDEDDDSDLSDGLEDEDMEDEEDDDEEDDENDDDDESEDDEEETLNLSQKKKKQKEDKNKTPNKQNQASPKKTPVTNGITPKEQKSNKKTPGGDKTPNNATPKQKQVLDHGVVVKEVKVGSGQPAKFGRTVAVHYIGKLKDGKVFDKQTKGEGFKFKLGKGEVIKGWDIGLQNMKVGGKRVIHCPPEAAYGAKGVPPKIPPNSTLVFDVELKNVY